MTQKDHDLLIRLETKFEEYSKNHKDGLSNLSDKLNKIFYQIEQKADKEDLRVLRAELSSKADKEDVLKMIGEHEDIKKRVINLEQTEHDKKTEKGVFLKIGKYSIKGWQFLSATIIFILTVYQIIKDLNSP